MTDQQTIEKLPNEVILMEIMSKLEFEDFFNFLKICKKFKFISNEKNFKKISKKIIKQKINKTLSEIKEIIIKADDMVSKVAEEINKQVAQGIVINKKDNKLVVNLKILEDILIKKIKFYANLGFKLYFPNDEINMNLLTNEQKNKIVNDLVKLIKGYVFDHDKSSHYMFLFIAQMIKNRGGKDLARFAIEKIFEFTKNGPVYFHHEL
ncbi:MAG: F-box protein [Candidatus Dojkabacteria bacterium]|nr:F-box protein [Candidatus Dojkabacteria bacterium]